MPDQLAADTLPNGATPFPGRAQSLHLLFREYLRASLSRLVAVVSRGWKLGSGPVEFVDSLDLSRRFSPTLYSVHWLLARAVQSQRARPGLEATRTLLALDDRVYAPQRLAYGTLDGGFVEDAIRDYLIGPEGPRGVGGELPEIQPLPEPKLVEEWHSITEALSLLRRFEPGVADEFDEYVSEFRLFQGQVVRGITSIRVFGAVHLRVPEPELSPAERILYYVDHITHETSHLQLHALMVEDPLVLNSDTERFPAPIRPDLRPLFGIYHGTFVLSRIVRVLGRWAEATGEPLVASSLETAIARFDKGASVLAQHASMTPRGASLLSSMHNLVEPWR